ncbi:MAG TPA: response regulator [Acidimicrobiales bacterium]|nr:response regulator [Acidimicrobiales bacterium]
MGALPSGVVTFLVTDIENSTAMWDADTDSMTMALARHDELVERTVSTTDGVVIKSKGEGDATLSVFQRASQAADAAVALQRALRAEKWPGGLDLRVRVALHTGEANERDGDYYGPTVNRAARLRALAAGRQTLVSQATVELVHDRLPKKASLIDLGPRRLRGVSRPERVYELCVDGAGTKRQATRVRVLLADDHPLWRQTLRDLLEQGGVAEIVGEAGSGDDAVAMADKLLPRVVVMDVDMPGRSGVEATRVITSEHPDVRVLMLSSLKERDEVLAAVRAGASGYLLKTTGPTEVADAIRRVDAGEMVFPPELSSLVLAELRSAVPPPATSGLDALTERERSVLRLMADGDSNQAIAKSLHLSTKTVEAHIAAIFTKLGLEAVPDQNRRVRAVVAFLGNKG